MGEEKRKNSPRSIARKKDEIFMDERGK